MLVFWETPVLFTEVGWMLTCMGVVCQPDKALLNFFEVTIPLLFTPELLGIPGDVE